MNGIDTLRKKYTTLSPEERASMFFTEVATHRRKEVVLALRPATTMDSLKTLFIETTMLVVAGHALTAALLAERRGLATMVSRDSSLNDAAEASIPAWTEAAAWALALNQLQRDTGLAFLAAATLLESGPYLADKIAACAGWEVDSSKQYDELVDLWRAGRRQIEDRQANR